MSDDAPPPGTTGDEPARVTSGEAAAHERTRRWIEVASTVLLALATVATAWAGYQSSRWHGKQAQAQSAANAARVDATRLSGVANRKAEIDVEVFTQWVNARSRDETALATFFRRRFTDRFEPAFEAWIRTRPFTSTAAAETPFELPQYVIVEQRQSDALETKAKASAALAKVHIERADDYVLCVVLFASALFFAGISTRLATPRAEAIILSLGWALFLGTLIWMATFPATVSI